MAFDNNAPPDGRVAALVALMARKAAGVSGGTGRVAVKPVAPGDNHREADRDGGPSAGAPSGGASPAAGDSGKKSIFKSKSESARAKVATRPQDPNAEALGELGDDYGLTWPQDIDLDLTAKMVGDEWVPVIKSISGSYSRQIQLTLGLNGVQQLDIPNARVATRANFQNILDSLENLGTPASSYSHYSLAAVQAHEDQHANRVRLALENIEPRIKASIESITVSAAIGQDEASAIARIQADPRYDPAREDAVTLWNDEFDKLIGDDHDGNGPCEIAERRVTTALSEAIRQRAIKERWIATPPQKTGADFAPSGRVSGIAASVGNQPAPTQKPQINLPPKASWPPKK